MKGSAEGAQTCLDYNLGGFPTDPFSSAAFMLSGKLQVASPKTKLLITYSDS